MTMKVSYDKEAPLDIDYCSECKFAHDLTTKLYTCNGDQEELIYCDKHGVMCRAMRQACDWAAISAKI